MDNITCKKNRGKSPENVRTSSIPIKFVAELKSAENSLTFKKTTIIFSIVHVDFSARYSYVRKLTF